MMTKLLLGAVLVLFMANHIFAAARDVPAAIAPPYAADRALLATDFVRFDWKDDSRNRAEPVKIYFPTDAAGPFPVIVFSHGLGGTREGYEYLGRQWAANGYVCVHVQHAGSDDSAWRGQAQPMQAMRAAANLQNSLDRPKDVKFVVDQLASLNKDDAKLKGKLDLSELAMAGHSFGAMTTMMIAGQKFGGPIASRFGKLSDDRFKVALAMSAGPPISRANLDDSYADIHIPTFFMTGTKDDSPIGDTTAADRRIPFDHTHAAATYLMVLKDGDHMVFSGRIAPPRPGDDDQQRLIRLASTAFFDAYLKNDEAAKKWLDDGGFKSTLGDGGTFERK